MGSGQGDCVTALSAGAKLADDNCTRTFAAICECEP
jgi:hypothetical protein